MFDATPTAVESRDVGRPPGPVDAAAALAVHASLPAPAARGGARRPQPAALLALWALTACPPPEPPCVEDASIADCPESDCAFIIGTRLDTDAVCTLEQRGFCLPGPGVDAWDSVAVDPDGARWFWAGSVGPAGWTVEGPTPDELDTSRWAPCVE